MVTAPQTYSVGESANGGRGTPNMLRGSPPVRVYRIDDPVRTYNYRVIPASDVFLLLMTTTRDGVKKWHDEPGLMGVKGPDYYFEAETKDNEQINPAAAMGDAMRREYHHNLRTEALTQVEVYLCCERLGLLEGCSPMSESFAASVEAYMRDPQLPILRTATAPPPVLSAPQPMTEPSSEVDSRLKTLETGILQLGDAVIKMNKKIDNMMGVDHDGDD